MGDDGWKDVRYYLPKHDCEVYILVQNVGTYPFIGFYKDGKWYSSQGEKEYFWDERFEEVVAWKEIDAPDYYWKDRREIRHAAAYLFNHGYDSTEIMDSDSEEHIKAKKLLEKEVGYDRIKEIDEMEIDMDDINEGLEHIQDMWNELRFDLDKKQFISITESLPRLYDPCFVRLKNNALQVMELVDHPDTELQNGTRNKERKKVWNGFESIFPTESKYSNDVVAWIPFPDWTPDNDWEDEDE